ncbi:MAG TPA: sulfate ABC transporter substrate-binding protein [Actinomycetes bacterium]|jgi:sulfate transport system substrate-binding protein|nr:sulfate ABC transporter substrate-binding protein [Actinomycetes bacterium]
MTVRTRFAAALLVAGALLAAGCGGSGGSGGSDKLTLVAYSTPREAYEQLIPGFQKTDAGKGVGFSQSYGSSGDQSRAIQNGLAADVVTLALEPDMTKLVDAGLVAKEWNADDHKGMITNSVVVFVTRKGNPKNIRSWDDLVKPGVEVITPNPFTSGGARWNIMAAYGAQLEQGKSHEQAVAYLEQLFRNVPVQDKSAREALQTFIGGKGDVMLAYENEAITAQQKEQPVDYTVPDSTILIENPIAVVSKSRNATAAKAFVDYLRTAEAQQIFADKGYRPVNQQVAATAGFPRPAGMFTIKDLGGWPDVTKKFFDKEAGIVAGIERKVGVSIGS